jgi:divalent metal cation (Fe/Co/Zn/Cd) transporter
MDVALPAEEIVEVKSILDCYQAEGISYHSLRSRQAAARKFLVVHLLVPGDWTVRKGHQFAEEIEQHVIATIPHSSIVTHIEPIEDPISLKDISLDRG